MKTHEIKRILVPVDFGDKSKIALSEAVNLAGILSAELHLIHVIEYKEHLFLVEQESQVLLPTFEEREAQVEKRMNKIREDIEKTNRINAKVFITDGHIYSEIIDYAEKKKINLIVMGTHGASGYKEYFIGSNAQRVVTLSEIPVLTIQKLNHHLGFKNILIPIDNSLHSRQKINLAIVFAEIFQAHIHLIGLPESETTLELNKFKIKLKSVEDIIESDGLSYTTTIVHGNSLAKAAIDYSKQHSCDLIVINTGHESKITGIFLGAFAQQIVNHSDIPVLSIKHTPDHYVIETPGFGV